VDRVLDIIARFDGPGFRSHEDRNLAIDELRTLGLEPLIVLLAEPDPQMRIQAATAAIMTYTVCGQVMILPLLHDPDSNVRWHVCGLMHDFGTAQAVPALVERLRTDSTASVRVLAADALGRIAEREPLPSLAVAALREAAAHDHEMTVLGHTPSGAASNALSAIEASNGTPSGAAE
jgi:HEAT repeat protein